LYRTTIELNSIVDGLHGHPLFKCKDMKLGNESLQFHFRDILPCICVIYGDPEFAQDLVFSPEQHYVDDE